MKCLFIALFFLSLIARGGDTLTRAQVYNFSAGDTFDYHWQGGGTYGFPTWEEGYTRKVVASTHNSANGDTMFVTLITIYPQTDTENLVYTNTQVAEVYLSDTNCSNTYYVDTDSKYGHHLVNGVSHSCFGGGGIDSFGQGLGNVYSHTISEIEPSLGYYDLTRELIYYSKGNDMWGTPLFNSASLAHYTPIPEECATWSDNIYFSTPGDGSLKISEQIRSGSKAAFHGHTYVTMIYRGYNYTSQYFTNDSIIGYYRNDTLHHKALFYQTLADTAFMEYDFDSVCPAPGCISQVQVGNEWRAKWPGYIEGVGGTGGLIPVKAYSYHFPGLVSDMTFYGILTCFSICGQTIYPSNAAGDCGQITGISGLKEDVAIGVYPTVNTGQFAVAVPTGSAISKMEVYNVYGQLMYSIPVTEGINDVDLNNVAPGIYLLAGIGKGQITATGKMVIK